jgi:hypothetical protein
VGTGWALAQGDHAIAEDFTDDDLGINPGRREHLFIYLFYCFYIYSHVYTLFATPSTPHFRAITLLFFDFVEEKT